VGGRKGVGALTQTANITAHVVITPSVGVLAASIPTVNAFQNLLYKVDLENVFMNSDEFAEPISYIHSSTGEVTTYAVLFDDPQTSVKLGSGPNFNGLRPQFMISEAELSHRILKRDRCTVRGVDYGIEDFESDGVGVTTVFLRLLS